MVIQFSGYIVTLLYSYQIILKLQAPEYSLTSLEVITVRNYIAVKGNSVD